MLKKYNPSGLYAPETYWNAVEVPADATLVCSAGIVGMTADHRTPADPEQQVNLAWDNVMAFLAGARCDPGDIVRLKIHYADRDIVPLSVAARRRCLGEHSGSAVTGTVVGLVDPDWLLEIEVTAVRRESGGEER